MDRSQRAHRPLTGLLLALALVAGGPGSSRGGESAGSTVARPTVEQLVNGTYAGVYETPVRLSSGRFEGEPFQPGAASRPTLTLIPDHIAFADLDGDGSEEGVVLLIEDSGGSGSFVYLALVTTRDDRAESLATTLIGDRVRVVSLAAGEGRILVRLIAGRHAAAAGSPPREIVREWDLRDGVLVERKIRFDLDSIDEQGLIGTGDGKRALSYEFCVPRVTEYLDEVRALDPSAEAQPGARGRIGCTPGQLLFIGSTHQLGFRDVLRELATRPYITRIEQAFFE